jgi:hypothetical protein
LRRARDGGSASGALFFRPQALTRCMNGDLFVSDTGNQRIRRINGATHAVSTVLGDGTRASAGQGTPSAIFPVDTPLELACDGYGNLFVTSSSTLRLLPSDSAGVVAGTGPVMTIFGAPPRDTFPASLVHCLSGVVLIDDATLQLTDSCTGMLLSVQRN